jgi:hypothetical protein
MNPAESKLLAVVTMLVALYGSVQIYYSIRNRAMRDLATKWGLRYVGPPLPRWWWPVSKPVARPPVPSWVSHLALSGLRTLVGQRISRIYNVVEGTRNGQKVLIFDVILGKSRNTQPCTIVACQTEENPFGRIAAVDRIVSTNGWTVLHGVWFLWFCWWIRVRRLEQLLARLNAALPE